MMFRTATSKRSLRRQYSSPTTTMQNNFAVLLPLLMLLLRDVDAFTAPTMAGTRTLSRPATSPVLMAMPIEAWNRFLDEDEIQSSGGSTAVLDPPAALPEEEVTLPELGLDGVYHIQSEAQYR